MEASPEIIRESQSGKVSDRDEHLMIAYGVFVVSFLVAIP
jgi:hypothetical protein